MYLSVHAILKYGGSNNLLCESIEIQRNYLVKIEDTVT